MKPIKKYRNVEIIDKIERSDQKTGCGVNHKWMRFVVQQAGHI